MNPAALMLLRTRQCDLPMPGVFHVPLSFCPAGQTGLPWPASFAGPAHCKCCAFIRGDGTIVQYWGGPLGLLRALLNWKGVLQLLEINLPTL